jgi:hypothetical protein
MSLAYCDQGDLEIAVGGAARLLQLADYGSTGDINNADVQATIAGWLEDEAATVRSKAEIKHDPETLANMDEASLRKLKDANATLSARTAYEKGAGGLAMPTQLEARAARVDKYLDELATGRARLGRVSGGTAAAINQPAKIVDYDSSKTGISIDAFKLGFR